MTVPVLTASWRVMADRHATGDTTVVPVRISLGKPRFWPLAASLPYVHELAPAGLLHRDLSSDEFALLYVQRLDRIGFARIARLLEAVHANYGRPLALCCFEADRADCHRGLASAWLEQHGFGPVREVESPTGRTAKPAQNTQPESSGHLSAQLSLQEDR